MNLPARRVSTASLAALIIVGLLPAAALAASPTAVARSVSTAEDTLKTITLTGTDPDSDALSFTITAPPTKGTLSTIASADCTTTPGTCTADVDYTPAGNYNGPDSFTFQVDDGTGGTDTAVASITVTPVNDPPVAVDDPVNPIIEDTTTTLFVLANDTDPENDTRKITGTSGVSLGVVNLTAADTRLSYRPTLNATGTDTFDYTISDGHGGTDTGTVTVQITPVNDAPAGTNKAITIDKNTVYTFTAADFGFTDANDTPPDDLLSVRIATVPSVGALENDGTTVTATSSVLATDITAGKLTFTPATNSTGTPYTSFTFQVRDDGGTANSGVNLDPSANTITINVTGVNSPPAGTNKTITTNEDTAHTFTTAEFGFTDPNDSPADALLAVKIATLPTAGTLRNDAAPMSAGDEVTAADITANKLTFMPAANANGTSYASFTFQVRDNGGTAGGGVDLDPTPNAITINVAPVNDPPVAVNDPTNPIAEDVTTTLDVLANDSDPENSALTITAKTNGAKGTVTIINAGSAVSYDPNPNATGPDTFTYTISDGSLTDTATVTVQTSSTNDPPVAGNDPTNPIVEDVTTTLADLLVNDSDPDGDTLTITAKTNGTKGTATIISAGTAISYDPNPNATGTDTFTYTISDGSLTDTATVTVQISAVNDAPVGVNDTYVVAEDSGPGVVSVLGNDTDVDGPSKTVSAKTNPSHGTLTLVGGTLTYTPALDFNGTDSFGYTVSDGSLTDTGTVTITVSPVNDAPVAVDDSKTIDEDSGSTAVAVLGNDTDVDLDGLSVTAKTDPAHGVLTLTSGVLSYTPAPNYHGPDSFSYTVSDGTLSDVGSVSLTVTAVNDVPIATDDSATIARDAAATAIGVLANDTDADADPLLITARTNGSKGSVIITGGGTGLTYDPFTGYNGPDTFTYTISDGHGGTATATVTINITGANRPPNAVNDVTFKVPEGAGPTALRYWDASAGAFVSILSNDDDPDGDTFDITAKTNGAHGTVAITGGGTGLTYDPASLFKGTDTFTYTIRDSGGLTDTATVVVTVTRDVTPPVVAVPAERFIGGTVATTSHRVRIAWSATDPGSGIKSYQLQASVNGRTYATIALPSLTRTYLDRVLSDGASYRYRVRATDREGNVSAWRYTATFRPARFQESTSLATYTGTWATYKTTSALGGAVRYTSTLGRAVSFRFTAYDVALVMTKTASSGSADIYVDGVFASRINLRASSTTYRQLVFARRFATLGAHTIEVRPTGSGRVDVDAFAVLR